MAGDGLDDLESVKDRLVCTHLHDNDSHGDQHNPLFTGTVDWPRLASIIARSSYEKCISMEVTQPLSGIEDETEFLKTAFEGGTRFSEMVEQARQNIG
jgi:sugar phosphate isomerase/epimerase